MIIATRWEGDTAERAQEDRSPILNQPRHDSIGRELIETRRLKEKRQPGLPFQMSDLRQRSISRRRPGTVCTGWKPWS